jgi:ribose transport system ATP-binding protein
LHQHPIELRGVVKRFGSALVLNNVDLDLRLGEVHALAGGNGAGKSTLMKILLGIHQPDAGEIRISGRPVALRTPREAKAHGIAMVFQEFSLVPSLSIAENIFLTREPRRFGLVDGRALVEQSSHLLRSMSVELDPRARVAELGPAHRQIVEIAKALSQRARVLVLDEPTASLGRHEVHVLFALLRRLRSQDVSIIYISHRVEELIDIADRVSVLRDGVRVVTADVAGLDVPRIVEHIVGRAGVSLARATPPVARARSRSPALRVRGLSVPPRLGGIDFDLYAGEILGVAGLLGSGIAELAMVLFGSLPARAGEIVVEGTSQDIRSPREAIAAGLALVPADRRTQGLVLTHSVASNLILPSLDRLRSHCRLIDDRGGIRFAKKLVRQLSIATKSVQEPVERLSGGNQQKVVLGKWLATERRILVLSDPTVGIDIGGKAEILDEVRALAAAGAAILFISSELTELMAASDRILVLREGRVAQSVPRSQVTTEEELHLMVQGA